MCVIAIMNWANPFCVSSLSPFLSLSRFGLPGAWRWSRRYCVHRLLSALQALHAAADAQAGERSAQSHRFGLHTGTR